MNEETEIFINIYTKYYSSFKKKWKPHIATCSNISVLTGHYAKWNKTDIENKHFKTSVICKSDILKSMRAESGMIIVRAGGKEKQEEVS